MRLVIRSFMVPIVPQRAETCRRPKFTDQRHLRMAVMSRKAVGGIGVQHLLCYVTVRREYPELAVGENT